MEARTCSGSSGQASATDLSSAAQSQCPLESFSDKDCPEVPLEFSAGPRRSFRKYNRRFRLRRNRWRVQFPPPMATSCLEHCRITRVLKNCAIDPGHVPICDLVPQVASACAIAINVLVHSPNEPEKSSIDVLSPRLNDLGNPGVHIGIRKSCCAWKLRRQHRGSVTDPSRCRSSRQDRDTGRFFDASHASQNLRVRGRAPLSDRTNRQLRSRQN